MWSTMCRGQHLREPTCRGMPLGGIGCRILLSCIGKGDLGDALFGRVVSVMRSSYSTDYLLRDKKYPYFSQYLPKTA